VPLPNNFVVQMPLQVKNKSNVVGLHLLYVFFHKNSKIEIKIPSGQHGTRNG
jgi:hypothetical protein